MWGRLPNLRPIGKIGLPPDAKHILVAAVPLCGAANLAAAGFQPALFARPICP